MSYDRHADNLRLSNSEPIKVVPLARIDDKTKIRFWKYREVAMIRFKFTGYHFTFCVNHVRSGTRVLVHGDCLRKKTVFKQQVVLRGLLAAIDYNSIVNPGASTPGQANERLGQNIGVVMVGDFNLEVTAVRDALTDPSVQEESMTVFGGLPFPGWGCEQPGPHSQGKLGKLPVNVAPSSSRVAS